MSDVWGMGWALCRYLDTCPPAFGMKDCRVRSTSCLLNPPSPASTNPAFQSSDVQTETAPLQLSPASTGIHRGERSTAIGTPVWPPLMPGLCPLLGMQSF